MPKKLKHYKQSRYKAHRKPVNKTLLIAIISAVVILALSIALGLYLGKISAPEPDADKDTENQSTTKAYDGYPKINPSPTKAIPLLSSAYENEGEAESTILRASGELAGAISVILLDENGAPCYKSEAYRRIYSAESGTFDIGAFIEKASKSELKTLGIFGITSFSEGNKDIRTARQDFELVLLSELYNFGLRELVLTGLPLSSPDALYTFMLTLKKLCPDMCVGISVSENELENTILCAELDDIFDFLVFDFTRSHKETVADCESKAENDDEDKDESEATDDEGDTNEGETTEPAPSPLYSSIERAIVTAQRFGARIYIDIGDGCELCKKTAKETLTSLEIDNFILASTIIKATRPTESE